MYASKIPIYTHNICDHNGKTSLQIFPLSISEYIPSPMNKQQISPQPILECYKKHQSYSKEVFSLQCLLFYYRFKDTQEKIGLYVILVPFSKYQSHIPNVFLRKRKLKKWRILLGYVLISGMGVTLILVPILEYLRFSWISMQPPNHTLFYLNNRLLPLNLKMKN